jgi:hypothetical protein
MKRGGRKPSHPRIIMYEDHPVFAQPISDTVKVWRYMDFTKFVSLIDSRCLFFTRADKFNDSFEGSWPKITFFRAGSYPTTSRQTAGKRLLEQ